MHLIQKVSLLPDIWWLTALCSHTIPLYHIPGTEKYRQPLPELIPYGWLDRIGEVGEQVLPVTPENKGKVLKMSGQVLCFIVYLFPPVYKCSDVIPEVTSSPI
jgi:hypothetical protein